ncbi:hypothetical protein F6V30_14515 [Oryzomonas sagensis]|uniref:DUF4116 domain-containing protein n=1 Tax=Oryzomonas sagensis TaxID=2603857 RepID=A0ABQ6TLC3_9BACT|nr:hypothetical protein [Oryzomonas sagensis]KAB0669045.1 hypothetical protein F6V30_14515 [Oryzomonas sagensis]
MYEIDWTELVKIIISAWVATVATIALSTWRRQSKAQRQIDFMDELTNSVHEFVDLMSTPIHVVRHIKIKIECHKDMIGQRTDVTYPEAIVYIEKYGIEDSSRLFECLKVSSPALAKICSLATKGQVLGFRSYEQCIKTCQMLSWQHGKLQAVATIIGDASMNWQNPEVQKSLNMLMQIDPEEIFTQLQTQNIEFLEFVKTNYEKIFK